VQRRGSGYRYEFVLLMHRHEDVAGARIIDGITRTAVERDGGHQRVGRRIDHRIRVSMFVGHEDSLRTGSVGDAVRIFDRSSLCDGLEGFHIDNGDLVLPGGRCIDSAQLRNCPNTVNVGEAIEVRHNATFLSVENDELICVHLRDVRRP
jgi:hypothetical protein